MKEWKWGMREVKLMQLEGNPVDCLTVRVSSRGLFEVEDLTHSCTMEEHTKGEPATRLRIYEYRWHHSPDIVPADEYPSKLVSMQNFFPPLGFLREDVGIVNPALLGRE